MSNLKPKMADWIVFLIHKRNSLDEITNNIWRSYYAERTISLTAITILTTSILALASIYHQIGSSSLVGSIDFIPLLSAFLSGIDVVVIGRFFQIRGQVLGAIIKLIPYRLPLDEMLLKIMNRKYKNIIELEKDYESKLKSFQDCLIDLSKPVMKRMNFIRIKDR